MDATERTATDETREDGDGRDERIARERDVFPKSILI